MIQVAHSTRQNAREAAQELAGQLGNKQPKVLLCFSSTQQDHRELVRELHRLYHESLIVGATTAGEIVSGKMLQGAVVAMSLGDEVVEKAGAAVVDLANLDAGLDNAFKQLGRQLGGSLDEQDPDTTVGIVLADGLSGAEERLIESLASRTEIPFVGGSAGDDLKFERTSVFLGGSIHQHSALLLVLRLPSGYQILKTQSFEPMGRFLEATEVDESNRKILAFDGRPAVYAYAEAVGALPDAISESFMKHPLARLVGTEPFIRSPQKIEGTAIKFYCAVKKGEKLAVMQASDILRDTKGVVEAEIATSGPVRAIVDFHCILRALELRAKGQDQAYGALFQGVPTIGFCTYGEALTTHINQTSTMLILR